MATDYDDISSEYQRSKGAPWRRYLEEPSYLSLVGAVSGLSVLDLACGEGFYTRRIAAAGAARVLGVDSSEAMIALAREAEPVEGSELGYELGDARTLALGTPFDLVTAAYLLNYAADGDELAAMCATAARHLRSGCRFVGINSNPDFGPVDVDYRRYGFERLLRGELVNGSPFAYRNHLEDGTSFDVSVYHLDAPTHDRAFTASGFSAPRWVKMTVSDAGRSAYGPGYWDTFLEHPPVVLFEAVLG